MIPFAAIWRMSLVLERFPAVGVDNPLPLIARVVIMLSN